MVEDNMRTHAIVMATMIGTVLVALATSLPMYDVEITITRYTVDYTYHEYYYLDYVDTSDGSPTGFEYRDGLRDIMWVVKVFMYIWMVLAMVFAGMCLLDEKALSVAAGFSTIVVSIFTLVYFAAKMGGVYSTGSKPGLGYIFLLVAFVMQMLALLWQSWHFIPAAKENLGKSSE